jgi:general stress protein YciG
MTNQGNQGGTSNRGFASMDEAQQREIASKGGKAAHQKGTAHEFTSDEAREAGRKGGQVRSGSQQKAQQTQTAERGFSGMSPEQQREIARKGGESGRGNQ